MWLWSDKIYKVYPNWKWSKSVPIDRHKGFRESIESVVQGTLNICRHRKVISTRSTYRSCCSDLDKLDAMRLSLKTGERETMFGYYCGEVFHSVAMSKEKNVEATREFQYLCQPTNRSSPQARQGMSRPLKTSKELPPVGRAALKPMQLHRDFGVVSEEILIQNIGPLGWRPGPGKFAKNAKTCPHCDVTFRKPKIEKDKKVFDLQFKTC